MERRIPKVSNDIIPPYLIVGEGNDEVMLLQSLFNHKPELSPQKPDIESFVSTHSASPNDSLAIEETQGKDRLKDYLVKLQVRTGFEKLKRLLIFRDADDSPVGAYQSVKSSLKTVLGIEMPNIPAANGTWSSNENQHGLRVGVFILPNNEDPGMLEDLYLAITRSKQYQEQECIDAFIRCLEQYKDGNWAHRSKAETLATFAALHPKNHHFSKAFKPEFFDHVAMKPVLRFLEDMKG